MEFQGFRPSTEAKRRLFAQLVEACGGDAGMADDLVLALAGEEPTIGDLKRLLAHAREVAADIADERRKR